MSTILVYLQQSEGKLSKASLCALTAARALKDSWSKTEVQGVCFGSGAKAAAESAAGYGISQVLYSEDASLEKYLAIPYAAALVEAFEASGADTIVSPSTTTGKDLMPRVAAMLEAAQVSDIVAVNADGSLTRPMYAGNVFADVEVLTERRVVTVRTTSFAPAELGTGGSVSELSVAGSSKGGEVVSYEFSGGERPELGDAEVVVSGGRALQSSENFEKYIFPLADAFGAAVGASRAAVDSGYAPNDWQVGQTGKVVAPSLYFAIGISGAIQHLAGMKDSKVIVAINKDPDAPIFEVADYGLVADLYEVVEPLTAAVQKAKS